MKNKDLEVIERFSLAALNNYGDFVQSCYLQKRYLGMDLDLNILKPPTPGVRRLYRMFRDGLVKRHFEHISYDANTRNEQGKISLRAKTSLDMRSNDLTIIDKNGAQIFTGFSSKVMPFLVRSGCPAKQSLAESLNKPTCGVRVNYDARTASGLTFDGKSFKDVAVGDCMAQIATDGTGDNGFFATVGDGAVSLIWRGETIKVTHETITDATGAAVTPADKSLKKIGAFYAGRSEAHNGIFVKIPNGFVVVVMEGVQPDDQPDLRNNFVFVKSSRIFKGLPGGMCGNLDGTPANDKC